MPSPIFSQEKLQEALQRTPETAQVASRPNEVNNALDPFWKPAPKGIGKAPYAAAIGGLGADALSTFLALNSGKFQEINPQFSWMGSKAKIGVPIIRGLQAVLATRTMKKLQESGHPTAAKTVGYLAGASGAIPALLNTRLMMKNK